MMGLVSGFRCQVSRGCELRVPNLAIRHCPNRRRPRPRNRKKYYGVEDEDETEDALNPKLIESKISMAQLR